MSAEGAVAATPGILAGVFVGGASRRMGGQAKGLLRVPGTDERIIDRLLGLCREAGLTPVLVGDAAPYASLSLGVPVLADVEGATGPLAGLAALLEAAGPRDAIALACDMPFVSAPALAELVTFEPHARIVAARRGPDAPWEPLFARYAAPAVRSDLAAAIGAGVRGFQRFFDRVPPTALPLGPAVLAALDDWDTPEDITAGAPRR